MKKFVANTPLPDRLRDGVIVVGKFDGFHRGHQSVVARARAKAGAEGRPLVCVTFDPHPILVEDPLSEPFRLTSLDQTERLCRRFGVDAMLVMRFDDRTQMVPPVDLVAGRIAELTGASAMMTGEAFGSDAPPTFGVTVLRMLSERYGIAVQAVTPVSSHGEYVSSARIRQVLRAGECGTAMLMLGRPFALRGVVVHGNRIGRTIGFPTANMRLGTYLRPRYGVYAIRGRLPGGRVIDGVANLGVRPMIEPPEELFEPHFLNFTGDLYDQEIDVELIRWMRSEVKLSGLDELREWIIRDCAEARAILADTPHCA